jgi:hypothetical protein
MCGSRGHRPGRAYALYITKLSNAKQEACRMAAAMEALILVAEKARPTMLARIGVMQVPTRTFPG